MMKFIQLLVAGMVLLGGGYWLGKSQPQKFAVVDLQKIVSQTAETLARQNLSPEQAHRQILQFKESLQMSLTDFAKQNNLLIVPRHSLFGEVVDQTDAFIAFYNREESPL